MAIQFAPRRALRAARILANDPDDLPQVFTIIESLSFDTLQRIHDRMIQTEVGRRLVETRADIVEQLADRAALARLPEGSLGRAYLDFVERENISAEGIRAAGAKGMQQDMPLPAPLAWVHGRMRDTHDLWHAAVGYGGDLLGETALLGFTFAQTWNPAIGLVLCIGLSKTYGAPDARRTIIDGFKRGLKAAWLPGLDWASMLALPLAEVRRQLSLDDAPVYARVHTSELKARDRAAA